MTVTRNFGIYSLRYKFALACILVEAIVLLALAWNSERITRDALLDGFRNWVQTIVPLLNVSLTNPLIQRDYATLSERLERIVQSHSLVYVEVRDELDQVAARHGDVPDTMQLDTTFDTPDSIYDQAFDIPLAGRVIGRARYGLNTSVLKATQHRQLIQSLALGSAALALTFLLLAALAHVLTRRLRGLAQAAQAIQAGDYSVRVAEGGRDEVAVAAHTFNAMAQTVERDIAERVQAGQALRESEERLRLALDAAHMGTFDWDVPRDHITWPRWHEELWGFQPGEFGSTYAAFVQRVHPDDMPGISAEVARCIAAREPFIREFRVVWPDDSTHWIAARGEFTFGEDGQPVRMRGAVVEITARKLIEEQTRRQLDELMRWQQVTLGREGRVRELKAEINALLTHRGEPARYTSEITP